MFITKQKHMAEVTALQAKLAEQATFAIELEARAERAERTAHEFAEEARYTLESAALAVFGDNDNNHLGIIANALPYLYSGRRHWKEYSHPEIAERFRCAVQQITRTYGFELPTDPVEAVKSVLELSSMLLVPSHSLPVDGLKCRYPLKQPQK